MYPKAKGGPMELLKIGVRLHPVIGEEMWEDFLTANRVPEKEQKKWLDVVNSTDRKTRENKDKELFLELKKTILTHTCTRPKLKENVHHWCTI
ncbi:hypothetical protein DPMN_035852 [Dreissena polymorpha]|uniref:Uncharacterized protein n=1 Tax=Dreissena polymorpha TaxID=45954 RepID=A0A9D4M9L5_DREPO|nr:hypothetical protein DPMN_035852 [Dreissena polymorpha]